MQRSMTSLSTEKLAVAAAAAILSLCLAGNTALAGGPDDKQAAGSADQRTAPDTYTAVTTAMQPAGVTLRFVVTQWSTDDERAAVVAALDDPAKAKTALADLPTVGVVWRSGSAIGSRIKYAQRETMANGDERVTLVTEQRLGPQSYRPWVADQPAADAPADFTVIQLDANDEGSGVGTMSFAAGLALDADSMMVSLDREPATPLLLTEGTRVPKPYWARAD